MKRALRFLRQSLALLVLILSACAPVHAEPPRESASAVCLEVMKDEGFCSCFAVAIEQFAPDAPPTRGQFKAALRICTPAPVQPLLLARR